MDQLREANHPERRNWLGEVKESLQYAGVLSDRRKGKIEGMLPEGVKLVAAKMDVAKAVVERMAK